MSSQHPLAPAQRAAFPPPILGLAAVHELGCGVGCGLSHGFDAAGLVGFAALLLGVIAPKGQVVWVAERSDLYPPGLMRLGLDPARIILAHAKDAPARLASMETALRGGLHAIGQERLNRLAARRLALAARQGGGVGLILAGAALSDSTACASRWRITPALSRQPDTPRWHAELVYARNTPPTAFLLEADCHGSSPAFTLVAGMVDHAPIPVLRRQAG